MFLKFQHLPLDGSHFGSVLNNQSDQNLNAKLAFVYSLVQWPIPENQTPKVSYFIKCLEFGLAMHNFMLDSMKWTYNFKHECQKSFKLYS